MSSQTTKPRRLPPFLVWLAIPVVAAGVAFAWWTISPLFISTRVDEAFPTAAPAAVVESGPTAPAAVVASQPTAPAAVVASQPTAPAAVVEAQPTADTMAQATAAVGAAEVMPQPTAAPAEPVALLSGSFTVIDRLHQAEGTATIYKLPDGSHVLRFENFAAQNGPDLRVGLAGHPMPRTSAELHETGPGYIEFEPLKASQGNQNYVLPADLDLSAYKSVVIYCKAFSVIFSTAELRAL